MSDFDVIRVLRLWRLEIFINKKWFLGYESYPTMTGGTYVCVYAIPGITLRVRFES